MLRDLLAQGAAPPGDWRVMMSVSAQGLRRMMLSRRDGARVFAGTYLTDDSLVASSEGPMSVLTAAGFPLREAVLAWQAVYCYVVGFCIEEQGMLAATGGRDTRYDAGARQKRLDPATSPLTFAAREVMFADADTRFEFGLTAIVDGVAQFAR